MTNPSYIPNHVGFVLDGNRRWAKENGLPVLEGHRRGHTALKAISKAAFDRGVKYVSVFVFSTENWHRTADEVEHLMGLASHFLDRDLKDLQKENIRLAWLGSKDRIGKKLLNGIQKAVRETQDNTGGTLALCFNYGGQQEILDATRALITAGKKAEEITKEVFEQALYAPAVPPVDLLIRTSGEQRLSGFMLYRSAYAELCFVDKFWPDFSEQDLDRVLAEYSDRERRIGR
ncbi:MAG TPA: polyprenyl diphosphate synthase [Verrucomicrobiae bacterium]|nr:polyprenyl diphosphate synthase [Verrucomicrobiae bacterium]